uniref:Olfactory receptor family 51 subfamily AC member 3 n=1 Tax=Nannospalax galili TaxID=1026970 RepID=A0A8C6R8W3_NANGA
MEIKNSSWFQPPVLLLTGIPGLDDVQVWLSIPLCITYLVAMLGNCTILFVIKTTSSLHEPQYLFLSMLTATDVGLSISTLPTVLNVFFIHTFSSMESAILLAMAFDRFVAIHNPLHYAVVLTLPRIMGMGFTAILRGVLLMVPLPTLLKRLPFCKGIVLFHCCCYHPDIMKLACGHVRVNIIYRLSLALGSFGVDSVFIVISYILILKTVLGIATGDGQLKALNTCVSHIFTVFIFYVPLIVLALILFSSSPCNYGQSFPLLDSCFEPFGL